jgi:hypothetical protein
MPQKIPCKVCGKQVYHYGRSYHPECKPVPVNVRFVHACPVCGATRKGHLKPGEKPRQTCRKCYQKGGRENPNWKGGVTPIARALRNSPAMKAWRRAVFERDAYTCQECGQKGGELQADHCYPFSIWPQWAFKVENGRTLCKPCHRSTATFCFGSVDLIRRFMPDPEQRAAWYAQRDLVLREILDLVRAGVTP